MTETHGEPIYREGGRASESRSPQDLIEIEWNIINKLLKITEKTKIEKHRAFYYQTLASHVRTLSFLLKTHTEPKQGKDLANLLSEIRIRAGKISKRLMTIERRISRNR